MITLPNHCVCTTNSVHIFAVLKTILKTIGHTIPKYSEWWIQYELFRSTARRRNDFNVNCENDMWWLGSKTSYIYFDPSLIEYIIEYHKWSYLKGKIFRCSQHITCSILGLRLIFNSHLFQNLFISIFSHLLHISLYLSICIYYLCIMNMTYLHTTRLHNCLNNNIPLCTI